MKFKSLVLKIVAVAALFVAHVAVTSTVGYAGGKALRSLEACK